MQEARYVPGTCNIGPAEIAKRKRVGWIGLVLTVIAFVLLAGLNAPRPWRLGLFLPATMSAAGFLQAYLRFCAHYGFSHLFLIESVGRPEIVEKAEFQAKDRRKSWKIIAYSLSIGAIVALVAYFVPV